MISSFILFFVRVLVFKIGYMTLLFKWERKFGRFCKDYYKIRRIIFRLVIL